jgi:hypothetical protein
LGISSQDLSVPSISISSAKDLPVNSDDNMALLSSLLDSHRDHD